MELRAFQLSEEAVRTAAEGRHLHPMELQAFQTSSPAATDGTSSEAQPRAR